MGKEHKNKDENENSKNNAAMIMQIANMKLLHEK